MLRSASGTMQTVSSGTANVTVVIISTPGAPLADYHLPAAQFFFKRYLEYEQQHGNAASVEHVKQAARDYVESAAAA